MLYKRSLLIWISLIAKTKKESVLAKENKYDHPYSFTGLIGVHQGQGKITKEFKFWLISKTIVILVLKILLIPKINCTKFVLWQWSSVDSVTPLVRLPGSRFGG